MSEQQTRWDASPAVDAQVEALLGRFSLEQKVELVSGTLVLSSDPWGSPPPEAPIPPFSLSDGGAGVRIPSRSLDQPNTTAFPAPIALAATWNEELARRCGDAIGAEARANGHNIVLGPAVDIARTPLAGRTFESYGEDPLLQARMAVPVVQGIQAHAVQACIKHYVVNNQEYLRNTIDVRVNERALQEIYLPPFAAAVREGGVASVMGAYNKINGTFACEQPHTLTGVLRDQFGFRGYVMSDFMATHSTLASALAGLDWELTMMGHWGPKLLQAVRDESVPLAALDEMVRRILRPTVGLGLLDHPLEPSVAPLREHGALAREIAEQAVVLLRHAGNVLPLNAAGLRTIAVIGPDADNIAAAGGGSALVPPSGAVSVVEGLRARVGDGVRVDYAPGTDPIGAGALLPGLVAVPSGVLFPAGGAPGECGVRAEYWPNLRFAGEPALVRTERHAELNRGFFDIDPALSAASPKLPPSPRDLPGRLSARWTGSLIAPLSGEYLLSLTSLGSARLLLDGEPLVAIVPSDPVSDSAPPPPFGSAIGEAASAIEVATATVRLSADESYAVTIEYAADAPEQSFFKEAMLRFGWQPPASIVTPLVAEAVGLARQADVAVVVARTFESEGMDRPSLRLPNGQDDLIRAVAAVNPRTVVVLMSGSSVETASWEDGVGAVLAAWYAGQEQGSAIARVLFGDVSPSGKLPLTFPRADGQTPLVSPEQYPGVDGTVRYTEGIFVGYRGYDRLGIAPQYPFGHGLSYTTFAYDDLSVTPDVSDGTSPLAVRFAVENTGARAGAEVAQVYLGLPADTGAPPLRLAGWVRAHLEPGERKVVTVVVDPHSADRPLSFWDSGAWATARGEITVLVGASSRDLRLQRTTTIG